MECEIPSSWRWEEGLLDKDLILPQTNPSNFEPLGSSAS